MSDDVLSTVRSDLITDADLALASASKGLGPAQFMGYLAMVIVVAISGLYLSRYSSGFDSNQYWERSEIAQEIAALGREAPQTGKAKPWKSHLTQSRRVGKFIKPLAWLATKPMDKVYRASFRHWPGLPGLQKIPRCLARIVLYGLHGPITVKGTEYNSIMAPLGAVLSDEQIALALTYVRQEWGNLVSAVEADVVEQARSETGPRAMWMVEELRPWDMD